MIEDGVVSGQLAELVSEAGGAVLQVGGEERRELKRKLKDGELDYVDMDAVVYTGSPNRNHVRFALGEMERFAGSFVDKPFLRNHDVQDVGSRDGTVMASSWDGQRMVQTIRLTTERGMRDFLEGVIDRFSIGWFYEWAECSVCGGDFMECRHTPGRSYDGARCEIVFHGAVGKEVSAVNAPAVEGTRVLSKLMEAKMEKDMVAEVVGPAAAHGETPGAASASEVEMRRLVRELAQERQEAALRASGLSEAGQRAVRLALGDNPAPLPDGPRFDELVEAQRAVEAAAAQRGLVQGLRPVAGLGQMETPEDRVQAALSWIFGASDVGTPPPSMRSIRDLYQAITGDSEWYGVFRPEFAQLAASTATLPGLVVNALNKVIRMHYDNMALFRWYEPLVAVTPHDGTTHDVQMVLVDGMANLPTVAEGAAYTEAVVGDSKEAMSFVKRGHYVGITLETIRKSDIQRLQAIPREMVKSAVRTRSAAIAGIFTANGGVGPTLADDSTALFDVAGHGNLGTAALDAAGWAAARGRIWKQTVPGTANRLGLWPTFCLVPIDLYDTALTLFGYGAGDVGKPNTAGTAQEVNPYGNSRAGDPRPIPVAVPEWTDATDWAYLVDPRLHPVIHMAYANAMAGGAHPMPEIFEVASETNGLMFTNDTLPVKVRDWWAYGVSTHVGIGKNNVAG